MEPANIQQFLPITFWAFSASAGVMIVFISFSFYLYYRKRLQALAIDSSDVAQLASQKQQLETDVQSLRSWIEGQKDELLRLEAERNEQEIIRSELQRLEQECASKEENNRSLRDEVGTLENQKHQLAQTMANLEREKDKYQDEIKQIEDRRQEIESGLRLMEDEFSKKRNEVDLIKEEVDKYQRNMTELEKTIREQKNELGDLEYRRDVLLRKNEELQTVEQQHAMLINKTNELKQELDDTRNELSVQQRIEDEVVHKVEKMQKLFDELERELPKMEKQTGKLEDELNTTKNNLKIKIKELEKNEKECEKVKEEAEYFSAKILKFKEEEIMLKTQIETLRALDKKLNLQLGNEDRTDTIDTEKYRDLWMPAPFPELKARTGTIDERKMLAATEEYIKGQKLHFPQRIVYAFHTALKISEISPLVVLAGISGTGKSELPRRYAEGMGMHFVLLAVQPRWDSPQDLFGFYNYLEGRYKATELARAMVQFELYNRKNWQMPEGWDHDRSDRMLLVLLDEMNLARVEYYFSEFLSRLETRRGINQTDEKDRAKAEIMLEMGSLKKDEKSIRLFPGQNILFAGTMNEDETTQALSDKVLDRACVMRFGRPKEIMRQPDSPASTQEKKGITLKLWQSWGNNSLTSSEEDKVGKWINRLNDSMEAIDRPFGHRVAQAIKSYVANYPSWIANNLELAMADQIEQRIMPKLRGVEVDEYQKPLKEIQKVIEECQDELLINAFRRGADSQQQVFIWRGLDRTR